MGYRERFPTAGLRTILYAQHDDSFSSSTDCAGFVLQSSIELTNSDV